MKRTKDGYEHDVTEIFALTALERGVNVRAFIKRIEEEREYCASKGMKGNIKLVSTKTAFGLRVLLRGNA